MCNDSGYRCNDWLRNHASRSVLLHVEVRRSHNETLREIRAAERTAITMGSSSSTEVSGPTVLEDKYYPASWRVVATVHVMAME